MKITIDVELSPKEARELFGWPDLSALHEPTLKLLQEQIQRGDINTISSLLQHYLDGSQNAFTMYSKLFENIAHSQRSEN